MKLELNYYDYLGIPDDSVEKAIRKAYKKKSLLVHPDKLKVESSDEFNKLKMIYDVLSDPIKKAAYDKQLDDVKKQKQLEAKMTERHRNLRESNSYISCFYFIVSFRIQSSRRRSQTQTKRKGRTEIYFA